MGIYTLDCGKDYWSPSQGKETISIVGSFSSLLCKSKTNSQVDRRLMTLTIAQHTSH